MGEQIVCPSGLSGVVRGLKTREADILAGTSGKKDRSNSINKVLSACWESTEDYGPYAPDIALDWNKVLQGDRIYTLLMMRRATHGSAYEFRVSCPDMSCKSRFIWKVDIDDLPVQKLPDNVCALFSKENRFKATVPSDGKVVYFRLPVGADEARASKLRAQHRDRLMTLAVRLRIIEIDGVDVAQLNKYIGDLPLGDLNGLMEQFEEMDCGVDTGLEIECPECYETFDVELPFDQNFFFPSRQLKAKKEALLKVI